jgi:hypothetical protein
VFVVQNKPDLHKYRGCASVLFKGDKNQRPPGGIVKPVKIIIAIIVAVPGEIFQESRRSKHIFKPGSTCPIHPITLGPRLYPFGNRFWIARLQEFILPA